MSKDNIRNWTINDYVNNAWTTLVKAPAKIRSLIIANQSQGSVVVFARIANGESEERSTIIPGVAIDAGSSQVVDLCQLNLGRSDTLQIKFSLAGASVTASGEEL